MCELLDLLFAILGHIFAWGSGKFVRTPQTCVAPALTRLLLQALVSALLSMREKAAIANEYAPYREQS